MSSNCSSLCNSGWGRYIQGQIPANNNRDVVDTTLALMPETKRLNNLKSMNCGGQKGHTLYLTCQQNDKCGPSAPTWELQPSLVHVVYRVLGSCRWALTWRRKVSWIYCVLPRTKPCPKKNPRDFKRCVIVSLLHWQTMNNVNCPSCPNFSLCLCTVSLKKRPFSVEPATSQFYTDPPLKELSSLSITVSLTGWQLR